MIADVEMGAVDIRTLSSDLACNNASIASRTTSEFLRKRDQI